MRRADYAQALARWATNTRFPVTVVENSGAALNALRKAAPSTRFVSFADDAVENPSGIRRMLFQEHA